MGRDVDLSNSDELIDAVMDMIARKWTKSMIKRELRDYFPNIIQSTVFYLIRAARKRIRERYNIDPEEFKGEQIESYKLIIRTKNKTADVLKALERLDKLAGCENLVTEDLQHRAQQILEFKRQAQATVGGDQNNGRDKTSRDCEDDETNSASRSAPDDGRANKKEEENRNSNSDSECNPEDDKLSDEMLKELRMDE